MLKDATSILTPTLYFNRAAVSHEYNYCYIPDFGRYYHKTDIVYNGSQVVYSFAVDPLASFKNTIGASSQYVLRSASAFDGDIIDVKYPTKTMLQMFHDPVSSPWTATTFSGGTFSIGIIGQNQIQYYLMSYTGFNLFFSYLLSDSYTNDVIGILGDIAPTAKIAVDPLQYIASCKWLPFSTSGIDGVISDGIKVGYSTIPAAYCTGINITSNVFGQQIDTRNFSFNKRFHPYAANRGNYLNSNYYTDIKINVPPVGWLDLDATVINSATSPVISVQIKTDKRTGDAVLMVYLISSVGGEAGEVREITRIQFDNSVDVPLSQIISQGNIGVASAASVAFQIASSMAGNAFAIPSAIMGAANAIESAARAVVPEARQHGTTNSIITYQTDPAIDYIFKIPVEDDNSQFGRPLCKIRQISALSGFIVCANVELEVNATFDEQRQIKNYMEGGFFYE